MIFKIGQKELLKHLTIARGGVSHKEVLPILKGFLLEAKNNKLKITGTDLEIGVETYVNCEVEKEGNIVIDAEMFNSIVRRLPSAVVEVEVNESNICIKCEKAEFNIPGKSAKDYPELPTLEKDNSFVLTQKSLRSAIRKTVLATSIDNTRPIFTGVLFSVTKEKVSFAALDGYRLAVENTSTTSNIDLEIIVPSKTLREISKIIDDSDEPVKITSKKGHAIFNIGETLIYSRLLGDKFINYNEIIRTEEEDTTSVIVNRRLFQESLERASLMGNKDSVNIVKLNIMDGKLLVQSNSEIGSVDEEVIGQVTGKDVSIGFNCRYLLDGIKVIEAESIRLGLKGSIDPCIIRPIETSYIYLVLPVRINN